LIFGGHAHVRDCEQLDNNSITLASGRYLETVGWLSVNTSARRFERRYLDNNRRTYQYHSRPIDRFDTAKGLAITHNLTRIAADWKLSHTFGVAPRNYYLTRHPITHESSVFHLLLQRVFPALVSRTDRPNPQPMVILNSGSVRFDISKGPFTKDSQSLCFPFINRIVAVADVPVHIAKAALESMLEYGEYEAGWKALYDAQGSRAALAQFDEEREHLAGIRRSAKAYMASLRESRTESDKRSYG
jgi:2',3'-cyclic-nucleotide 2'-phosphodiesterase (5'-nucleotidase family)